MIRHKAITNAIALAITCALMVYGGCVESGIAFESTVQCSEEHSFRYSVASSYCGIWLSVSEAESNGISVYLYDASYCEAVPAGVFSVYVFDLDEWHQVPFAERDGYPIVFPLGATNTFDIFDIKNWFLDFDYYFDGLDTGVYRIAYLVTISGLLESIYYQPDGVTYSLVCEYPLVQTLFDVSFSTKVFLYADFIID